jgi:hypothetical protein
MKCTICGKTIGKKDIRMFVLVYSGEHFRRVYACGGCYDMFDNWVKTLPTDDDGRPIDPRLTNRIETKWRAK